MKKGAGRTTQPRKECCRDNGEKPPQSVEEADRIQEEERQRLEKIIRRQLARDKGQDNTGEKPQATPWLLLRYSLADLGARPIPAGESHWRSPDIWIESSDPTGNGVAGEENFVHARIFNLGMAPAVPVKVDFYWADPSVGLGPSAMNLIGTEWVSVGSISSVDVRCNTPWIPLYVNNGHECLMVNCTNPILDPIHLPFQPRQDRHVGQRNVTVLQGNAGELLNMNLVAANIFSLEAEVEFSVSVQRFKVDPAGLTRLPFRALVDEAIGYPGRVHENPATLAARFQKGTAAHRSAQKLARMIARKRGRSSQPLALLPRSGGTALRLKAELGESLGIAVPPLEMNQTSPFEQLQFCETIGEGMEGSPHRGIPLLGKLRFKAYEMQRLKLNLGVPADAKTDELFVVDILQKTNGFIAGGYSLIVRILPQRKE